MGTAESADSRELLEECVPARLVHWLAHYRVETVTRIGCSDISRNGRISSAVDAWNPAA